MAETVDCGHGRIEQRRLQTSDILMGHSDWPGLAQVFQVALILDSRVLRDQEFNERRQQRFASLADVVYKLEDPR